MPHAKSPTTTTTPLLTPNKPSTPSNKASSLRSPALTNPYAVNEFPSSALTNPYADPPTPTSPPHVFSQGTIERQLCLNRPQKPSFPTTSMTAPLYKMHRDLSGPGERRVQGKVGREHEYEHVYQVLSFRRPEIPPRPVRILRKRKNVKLTVDIGVAEELRLSASAESFVPVSGKEVEIVEEVKTEVKNEVKKEKEKEKRKEKGNRKEKEKVVKTYADRKVEWECEICRGDGFCEGLPE